MVWIAHFCKLRRTCPKLGRLREICSCNVSNLAQKSSALACHAYSAPRGLLGYRNVLPLGRSPEALGESRQVNQWHHTNFPSAFGFADGLRLWLDGLERRPRYLREI